MTEAEILNRVLLAARGRYTLFRNNTGALVDRTGRLVRYGLTVGSSDLIGWETVTITPEMVGQKFARFLALEIKTPAGRVSGSQAAFIEAVNRAGGLARVIRNPGEL